MFFKKQEDYLRPMAIILSGAIRRLFELRGVELSSKPIIVKKNVVEFRRRMRLFGLEKFPRPTFVSSVNYYLTAKDAQEHNCYGAIVIYVEQEYIAQLIKLMQYPVLDDESDLDMMDACGAICNLIAGQFKTDLSLMGYHELQMSAFHSFRNSAELGVEFYSKLMEKYEISFFVRKEKRLVIEISMGPLPRIKEVVSSGSINPQP